MPPSKNSILGRAAAILAARKATQTAESAAEWAAKAIEARRRAFWSAKLYHAQHVSDLKEACLGVLRADKVKIRDLHSARWTPEELEVEVDPATMKVSPGSGVKRGDVEMEWTRGLVVTEMRARAMERGIAAQDKSGRIKLIVDMAVGMSVGRAKWEEDAADKAGLEIAPARQLVRMEPRKEPRDWDTRWKDAAEAVKWNGVYDKDGGETKIAMFHSPIWVAISAFGEPFPPFDYNSGMGVRDVFAYELDNLGWNPAQPQPQKEKRDVKIDVSDISATEREWLERELCGRGLGKVEDGKLIIFEKPIAVKSAMAAKKIPPTMSPAPAQVPATSAAQAVSGAKFVPASTIKEAEQYAKSNFARTVKYRGMTVEHANKVNEALTDLTSQFPTKPLETLLQNGRMRARGRAHWRTMEICERELGDSLKNATTDQYEKGNQKRREYIRRVVEQYGGRGNVPSWQLKTIKKIEESLKFKRWDVLESHQDKIRSLVAHEYGHVLSDQYFGMIAGSHSNTNYGLTKTAAGMKIYETNERWKDAFIRAKQNGDIYGISEYAQKNKYEFFAECFAAHYMGESLPDYIENLLLETLKNGIL